MNDIEAEARFNSILAEYEKLLRTAIVSQSPKNIGLHFEDIVQDACLRLWRALRDNKEIRNIPAYLSRIASTVTIDAVRRVKSRREEQLDASANNKREFENTPEGAQPVYPGASPEALAEQAALVAKIRAALELLTENRRRAVRLHLQGMKVVEIAELMGWSEAKATNLVYRGLSDLRGHLRSAGINYEPE